MPSYSLGVKRALLGILDTSIIETRSNFTRTQNAAEKIMDGGQPKTIFQINAGARPWESGWYVGWYASVTQDFASTSSYTLSYYYETGSAASGWRRPAVSDLAIDTSGNITLTPRILNAFTVGGNTDNNLLPAIRSPLSNDDGYLQPNPTTQTYRWLHAAANQTTIREGASLTTLGSALQLFNPYVYADTYNQILPDITAPAGSDAVLYFLRGWTPAARSASNTWESRNVIVLPHSTAMPATSSSGLTIPTAWGARSNWAWRRSGWPVDTLKPISGDGNVAMFPWEESGGLFSDRDPYLPAVSIYPHADLYIGTPTLMQRARPELMDVGLTWSVDGRTWTRYSTSSYIARGSPGQLDERHIYAIPGFMLAGDYVYQLYVGNVGTASGSHTTINPTYPPRMFSTRQWVDGFVTLDAGATEATARTVPIVMGGSRLHVNAKITGAGGYVKVAVMNASNGEIAGRSIAECDPIEDSDSDRVVTWGGNIDLSVYRDQGCKFYIVAKHAKVCSIWMDGAFTIPAPAPPPSRLSVTIPAGVKRLVLEIER